MVTSSRTPEPDESERRRTDVTGVTAVLADGRPWLLASPVYSARQGSLTEPPVDEAVDRIFESTLLNGNMSVCDVLEVARALLRANYELSDDEVARLLSVSPGDDCRALAGAVLDAIFGPETAAKTFTDWVRASLLANGLTTAEIPARDVVNTLAVLVATNRTVPLSRFADACRRLDERARLEVLL
jgi:hypothetical protein